MFRRIIFIILFQLIYLNLFTQKCFSEDNKVNNININNEQTIYLTKGLSYFMNFDEDIKSYKVDKKRVLKIEYITSIFNNKKSLLIKPIKKRDANLTIKTKSKEYKFSVSVNNKNKKVDNLRIDTPPLLPQKEQTFFNCEIDKPPMPKK